MSNKPPSSSDTPHNAHDASDTGLHEDQLSFDTEDFDAEGVEQSFRERELDSLADFANADTPAEPSNKATLSAPSGSLDAYEREDDYDDADDDYDFSDLRDDTEDAIDDTNIEAPEALDFDDEPIAEDHDNSAYQNTPEAPSGDDRYTPPAAAPAGIPWVLIGAAVFAVLLVAIGAYGVVKERAALKEEIRQLSSKLATAPDIEQYHSTQEALKVMEQSNADLRQSVRALRENNATLTVEYDALKNKYERMIATGGVSTQTTATQTPPKKQQVTRSKPTQPSSVAKTAPAKPAVTQAAPAIVKGNWFVNFGAYRDRAVASRWAKQLSTNGRQATVSTVNTANGTLYRVRISNQPSRDAANAIARELERTHRLERLWVGQQ